MRTTTLKKLIDDGFGDKLCPSHDCICVFLINERPDGTMPEQHDYAAGNPDQYLYMHRHVIPGLMAMGASKADIDMLFIDNPRRFLSAR